jgi:hypothetical protein
MDRAREAVGNIDSAGWSESNLVADDVFPIAAATDDLDLFVMIEPGAPNAGAVVWFAGGEIEGFADFDEYFLAMVGYNRRLVNRTLSIARQSSW